MTNEVPSRREQNCKHERIRDAPANRPALDWAPERSCHSEPESRWYRLDWTLFVLVGGGPLVQLLQSLAEVRLSSLCVEVGCVSLSERAGVLSGKGVELLHAMLQFSLPFPALLFTKMLGSLRPCHQTDARCSRHGNSVASATCPPIAALRAPRVGRGVQYQSVRVSSPVGPSLREGSHPALMGRRLAATSSHTLRYRTRPSILSAEPTANVCVERLTTQTNTRTRTHTRARAQTQTDTHRATAFGLQRISVGRLRLSN